LLAGAARPRALALLVLLLGSGAGCGLQHTQEASAARIAWVKIAPGTSPSATNITDVLYLPPLPGLRRRFGPFHDGGCGVDLTQDARWFAYCDWRFRVHLVDMRTLRQRLLGPRCRRLLGCRRGATGPAFSPDGRFLAIVTAAGPQLTPGPQVVYALGPRSVHRLGYAPSGASWARTADELAWSFGRGHRRFVAIARPGDLTHPRIVRVRLSDRWTFSWDSWSWDDKGLLFWSERRPGGTARSIRLAELSLSSGRTRTLATLPQTTWKVRSDGYGATPIGPRIIASRYPVVRPAVPVFAVIEHGRALGIPPAGPVELGGCCTVNRQGTAALLDWEDADVSYGYGIQVWKPGWRAVRELGAGVYAFWVYTGGAS